MQRYLFIIISLFVCATLSAQPHITLRTSPQTTPSMYGNHHYQNHGTAAASPYSSSRGSYAMQSRSSFESHNREWSTFSLDNAAPFADGRETAAQESVMFRSTVPGAGRPPEKYPLGDAVLPLLLFLMAYLALPVIKRTKR